MAVRQRGQRWAATAAVAVGLITLTACDGGSGGDETPTDAGTSAGEQTGADDATTEATTEATDPTYAADAIDALLPDLSPGGTSYGEDPNAIDGVTAPVTACYVVAADEEDGDVLNAFYGDYDTDAVWLTVVAAADNASGTALAEAAIEKTAACEGTVPENSPVSQASVDSGTENVAGAPAAFNVSEVETEVATVNDARVVLGMDNLVIEIVTGRPDADDAKAQALAIAAEVVEAIEATAG